MLNLILILDIAISWIFLKNKLIEEIDYIKELKKSIKVSKKN